MELTPQQEREVLRQILNTPKHLIHHGQFELKIGGKTYIVRQLG